MNGCDGPEKPASLSGHEIIEFRIGNEIGEKALYSYLIQGVFRRGATQSIDSSSVAPAT